MATKQAGAPDSASRPDASASQPSQMTASQPRTVKAPVQAAFGTGSGAAILFRDYASI